MCENNSTMCETTEIKKLTNETGLSVSSMITLAIPNKYSI